jgi:hypothetical protein
LFSGSDIACFLGDDFGKKPGIVLLFRQFCKIHLLMIFSKKPFLIFPGTGILQINKGLLILLLMNSLIPGNFPGIRSRENARRFIFFVFRPIFWVTGKLVLSNPVKK